MADTGAVKEADAIYQSSKRLLDDVEHEIKAMANAIAMVTNDVQLVDRLATQAVAHVNYLDITLQEDIRISKHLVEILDQSRKIESEINLGVNQWLNDMPIQEGRSNGYDHLPWPDFSLDDIWKATSVESLAQGLLHPLQARTDHWDKIAADFKTFDDMFDESMRLLNEAESSLQSLEAGTQKTERVPTTQSTGVEKQIE